MTEADSRVPQPDATLVKLVLAGDLSAYAELHDRYARLVRAICYDTTSDITYAQDISQDVFLRAYRRLADLRDPSKFAAWLIGITRLVCKEWGRARARDRHKYVGLNPVAGVPADPQGEDQLLATLRAAMRSLPARERLALHIFYLQDQHVDVARSALGLSRPGLYRMLARGRKRLRRRMQSYGEDVS